MHVPRQDHWEPANVHADRELSEGYRPVGILQRVDIFRTSETKGGHGFDWHTFSMHSADGHSQDSEDYELAEGPSFKVSRSRIQAGERVRGTTLRSEYGVQASSPALKISPPNSRIPSQSPPDASGSSYILPAQSLSRQAAGYGQISQGAEMEGPGFRVQRQHLFPLRGSSDDPMLLVRSPAADPMMHDRLNLVKTLPAAQPLDLSQYRTQQTHPQHTANKMEVNSSMVSELSDPGSFPDKHSADSEESSPASPSLFGSWIQRQSWGPGRRNLESQYEMLSATFSGDLETSHSARKILLALQPRAYEGPGNATHTPAKSNSCFDEGFYDEDGTEDMYYREPRGTSTLPVTTPLGIKAGIVPSPPSSSMEVEHQHDAQDLQSQQKSSVEKTEHEHQHPINHSRRSTQDTHQKSQQNLQQFLGEPPKLHQQAGLHEAHTPQVAKQLPRCQLCPKDRHERLKIVESVAFNADNQDTSNRWVSGQSATAFAVCGHVAGSPDEVSFEAFEIIDVSLFELRQDDDWWFGVVSGPGGCRIWNIPADLPELRRKSGYFPAKSVRMLSDHQPRNQAARHPMLASGSSLPRLQQGTTNAQQTYYSFTVNSHTHSDDGGQLDPNLSTPPPANKRGQQLQQQQQQQQAHSPSTPIAPRCLAPMAAAVLAHTVPDASEHDESVMLYNTNTQHTAPTHNDLYSSNTQRPPEAPSSCTSVLTDIMCEETVMGEGVKVVVPAGIHESNLPRSASPPARIIRRKSTDGTAPKSLKESIQAAALDLSHSKEGSMISLDEIEEREDDLKDYISIRGPMTLDNYIPVAQSMALAQTSASHHSATEAHAPSGTHEQTPAAKRAPGTGGAQYKSPSQTELELRQVSSELSMSVQQSGYTMTVQQNGYTATGAQLGYAPMSEREYNDTLVEVSQMTEASLDLSDRLMTECDDTGGQSHRRATECDEDGCYSPTGNVSAAQTKPTSASARSSKNKAPNEGAPMAWPTPPKRQWDVEGTEEDQRAVAGSPLWDAGSHQNVSNKDGSNHNGTQQLSNKQAQYSASSPFELQLGADQLERRTNGDKFASKGTGTTAMHPTPTPVPSGGAGKSGDHKTRKTRRGMWCFACCIRPKVPD